MVTKETIFILGLIDGEKSEHSTSQVKVFQQNATENSWNGSKAKNLSSDAMGVELTKADSSKFGPKAEGTKKKCFICRPTSTKLPMDRIECGELICATYSRIMMLCKMFYMLSKKEAIIRNYMSE